jgi:hypothetical protein
MAVSWLIDCCIAESVGRVARYAGGGLQPEGGEGRAYRGAGGAGGVPPAAQGSAGQGHHQPTRKTTRPIWIFRVDFKLVEQSESLVLSFFSNTVLGYCGAVPS